MKHGIDVERLAAFVLQYGAEQWRRAISKLRAFDMPEPPSMSIPAGREITEQDAATSVLLGDVWDALNEAHIEMAHRAARASRLADTLEKGGDA